MKHPEHIIITGASSGIGAALAHIYAGAGIRLGLIGRDAARLETVAKACRDLGADVDCAILNVTDRALMEAWLIERDDLQSIDLVIANAGISGGSGGAAMEGAEQFHAIMDVNIGGVSNSIQPLLPRMIARGYGQVAIMSSLAGYRGWPGAPAYCASKAAVRVYGEALRGQMAAHNIAVSVICPGFVKSPMTDVNDFPMPFMVDSARAARIIKKQLSRNKGRIVFPRITAFFAWAFMALPDGVSHRLLRNTPTKPQV